MGELQKTVLDPRADVNSEAVNDAAEFFEPMSRADMLHSVTIYPRRRHANGFESTLIGRAHGRRNGDEAMVYFGGFGTASHYKNLQMQAIFVRKVFERAGITTSQGDPYPFVVVGMPVNGSRVLHSAREYIEAAKGNFDQVGDQAVDVVQSYHITKAGLIGPLMGGVVALKAQARLRARGIDALGTNIEGHTATVTKGLWRSFRNFLAVGAEIDPALADGAIPPYTEHYHHDQDPKLVRTLKGWGGLGRYAAGIVLSGPDNLAFALGMGHPLLEADLSVALAQPGSEPITLARTMRSTLSDISRVRYAVTAAVAANPESTHDTRLITAKEVGDGYWDNLRFAGRVNEIAFGHLAT